MIEAASRAIEDLQHAVDEALWEYDPVRGALWELRAVAQPDGVVEVSGHVRSRSIRDGVIAALRSVPSVTQIVDRLLPDPELETRVARALAQMERLPPGTVAVHSHLGVVTLVGKLPDQSLRDPVLETAGAVSGVRSIDDRMQIGN